MIHAEDTRSSSPEIYADDNSNIVQCKTFVLERRSRFLYMCEGFLKYRTSSERVETASFLMEKQYVQLSTYGAYSHDELETGDFHLHRFSP
ncbi:hypothetical protein ScPMuIL_006071 [Solemya velum]